MLPNEFLSYVKIEFRCKEVVRIKDIEVKEILLDTYMELLKMYNRKYNREIKSIDMKLYSWDDSNRRYKFIMDISIPIRTRKEIEENDHEDKNTKYSIKFTTIEPYCNSDRYSLCIDSKCLGLGKNVIDADLWNFIRSYFVIHVYVYIEDRN